MEKTLFHCHSDNSLKDATMTIEELVKTGKKLGYNNITLTDHGNCIGLFEFLKCCKKEGINGIPGVEGYVDIPLSDKAGHIILVAKNYNGYCKICELVSEGHKNQRSIGCITQPIFTLDKIKDICSDNSDVICTSACVGGFLALTLTSNKKYEKEIKKQTKKIAKYEKDLNIKEQQNLKDTLEEIKKEIECLQKSQKQLKKIANKKYTFRQKKVSQMEDSKEKEESLSKLKIEIAETEKAAAKYEDNKKTLANLRRKRTAINKKNRKYTEIEQKINNAKEKIIENEHLFLPEEVLISETEKLLLYFKSIFGENFYIELQYKRIPEEKYVMPILLGLAKKHNVKTVIGNDAHIATTEDVRSREIMSALRFSRWQKAEPYWQFLSILTEEELVDLLCEILPRNDVLIALDNTREIGNICHVAFPKDTHYPLFTTTEDSKKLLREKSILGISEKFEKGEFDEKYQARLEYELKVICDLGYADYLLIVADFINYAKKYAKSMDKSNLGYGVGPGRGSGAGCLVNYLLGITNIDPLKYDLIFERFLNKDRVSMPDIDTDFSDDVREATIEYVKEKYGKESVASIRTSLKYAAKSSLRNVARVLAYEKSNNDPEKFEKIVKEYRFVADKICKLEGFEGSLEENYNLIMDKFRDNEIAKELYESARKIEGLTYGNGLHAAGIIIGDGQPLKEYVPLMYNDSKKQWAVQCDMVESEMDLGLLKMDFLGLKNLKIITNAIRDIYKNYGISIDPETIPFEEEVFSEIFSKGNTVSVFQFESFGMQKMLKEYKPENFDDIILPIAAYRPGPMDSIPEIIAVKSGTKKPNYCIPELEPILSTTYSKPIFQEQIMDIFHKCAGFTLGEADIIRRHMSKKHVDEFLSYKPQFIEGFKEKGATQEDADAFWNELVSFAEYAFNKSHATVYSLVSYQTAYLKYHYPIEFMCAILNSENDFTKIAKDIAECRRLGIKIFLPKVNSAYFNFTATKKGITYGFESIKGFSKKNAEIVINERKENGLFKSLQDFVVRTNLSEKATISLIQAGSFDDFLVSGNRESLLNIVEEVYELANELKRNNEKLEKAEVIFTELSEKENLTKKQTTTFENTKMTIKDSSNNIKAIDKQLSELVLKNGNKTAEKEIIFLKYEKELLGAFVSAHPVSAYEYLYKDGRYTKLVNITEDIDNTYYIGIINNLKIIKSKKSGKTMAFFELEDTTASTKICIYDNVDKLKELLIEGNIIAVKGKTQFNDFKVKMLKEQQEINHKEEIIEFSPDNAEIIVHEVRNISKQLTPGMLFIKSTKGAYDFYHLSKENDWQSDTGRELVVIDLRPEVLFNASVSKKIYIREELIELNGKDWHYQIAKDNTFAPVQF